MVSQKMHLKKLIFWTGKKVTCDTSKKHILFYRIKRKYAI